MPLGRNQAIQENQAAKRSQPSGDQNGLRALDQPWPSSPAEARLLQERLRGRVETEDRLGLVERVAGVDAHYAGGNVWAAAVLMTFPDLATIESALIRYPSGFPYVPGLLSFREAPAILEALARLSERPGLVLVDGHGYAHPRRFGLACHLGVLSDLPAIGVAKSRLVGRYQEPGIERGDWSALEQNGEVIGAALRTQQAVRPIFVSIGHRISLVTALDFTLRLTRRFRLPDPIRAADKLSRRHPPADGRSQEAHC